MKLLKKIGANLAATANWVGNHLGTLLTIFSAVVAFLFLRERRKKQEALTTLELDEKTDAVEAATQEVNSDQKEADDSLGIYTELRAEYKPSKRKQKRTAPRSGSKKRAAKRKQK